MIVPLCGEQVEQTGLLHLINFVDLEIPLALMFSGSKRKFFLT